MKKIIFLLGTILTITIFSTSILATGESQNSAPMDQDVIVETNTEENKNKTDTIINSEENTENDTKDSKLEGASEEIIGSISEKEKKIDDLEDKYGNRGSATIAYYLEQVRYYSTPIFFIFLTIGAFNFFIIGNKKLDKKEQGFGWISACLIGWVFFQCIPLAYALFVL